MKANLLCGFLAFAAAIAGARAYADVYVAYTGTIELGSDQTDMFGLGTDLTGASYSATFIFDPTQGIVYSDPISSYAQGGEAIGVPASPAIAAAITINGITEFIGPGNWYGDIYAYNDGTSSTQYHEADYFNNNANGLFIYNYTNESISNAGAAIPGDITQPFSYKFNPLTDSSYGYFQFYQKDLNSGDLIVNTFGYLNPTTLAVYDIPESSTWLMMLTSAGALISFGYFKKLKVSRRSV